MNVFQRLAGGFRGGSPPPAPEDFFDFDCSERSEPRNWREMDELCLVPSLVHGFGSEGKNLRKAENIIASALKNFPDYYFVHSWNGALLLERGKIQAARSAYLEGIRLSREKWALCPYLGMLEYKHGSLVDAVKWWVRSCLIQIRNKHVGNGGPFLYLSFMALYSGDEDASTKLLNACKRGVGVQGASELEREAEQDLSRKFRAANADPAGMQRIKDAVKHLVRFSMRDF